MIARKRRAVAVDPLDDFMDLVFTRERFSRLFDLIADGGFDRIYWYDYEAHRGLFQEFDLYPNLGENLKTVPNHTELAVEEAHKRGIEIFATYKPYEGGGFLSFAPGSERDRKYGRLDRIGGRGAWMTEWMAQHPHLRVERRMDDIPPDLDSSGIDRIVLHKTDAKPSGLSKSDISLWVSRDNAAYVRYEGEWDLREEVVGAVIQDYIGRQINIWTEPRASATRLTISGLNLSPEWKFIVVDAGEKARQFELIPMTMCRVYDQQGRKLPVTFAVSSVAVRSEGAYPQVGLDFDGRGHGMGIGAGYFHVEPFGLRLGIARGVNRYAAGSPCEAYPEVRRYWLDETRRVLGYGVDGIHIRIGDHSSGVQDPWAFGFNEPILAEYRRRAGSDKIAFSPEMIQRIRGDFLTQYIREASALVRGAGKGFETQLIAAYATGDTQAISSKAFHGVKPDWEHWVRDLVDGITMRDGQCRFYNPEFDRTIRRFARSLGRSTWINCYTTMNSVNLNEQFLEAAFADEDVGGIIFYELCGTYEADGNGFRWLPAARDLVYRYFRS